jgi:UDP-N-acetylglucosamine/UDP-N-acetylgalactosamine diphosphorylase
MSDRLDAARAVLAQHNQQHLLAFYDDLSPASRAQLLLQIESIDFEALDRLIDSHVRQAPAQDDLDAIEPADFFPRPPTDAYDVAHYRAAGEALIRDGRIAAFTVAGGQGTRLGWNGPKGTFPASVITGKPLFRLFAEQILATGRKYVTRIPWYIMTSPMNDADTRAFFQDNNFFGIDRADIVMFPQGTMPSIDARTGRVLLAQRDAIAVNPDGHGGSIKALRESGAIDHMQRRGIEQISYFQVDNPNVIAIDPLFTGLHTTAPESSGEMSSKMVAKAYPEEKVGVFCQTSGRTLVIEYSDLPDELAQQRDDHGALRYVAGNIAIHMLSVGFVEKLTEDAFAFGLPYHRADKVVPFINPDTGDLVTPTAPNAVKLETFVFDAIPLASKSIVLETDRTREFAPIKNADGVDSAATSHQLQSNRAGRWLAKHGVDVPYTSDGDVDARIEISALTALDADDLGDVDLPKSIAPGENIVL